MSKSVKVIDDPSVREFYSNKIVATSIDGAVLLLTLACGRSIPERTGEAPPDGSPFFVNCRLALPEATVLDLHAILGDAIKLMLKRKVEHARTVLAELEAVEKPRN
jgi:hypothetical protein